MPPARRPERRGSRSSGRTGTTSRRCSRRRAGSACRPRRRSASRTTCAAPESFTPDAQLPARARPEVPGLFVAAGLNSQGIIFGPGVGRAAAEWIVAGHPTMDLAEVDVARTGRWATQRRVAARADGRVAGQPVRRCTGRASSPTTARGLRRLPLHAAYRAAGAAFGPGGRLGARRCGSSRAPSSRRSATTIVAPSWFAAVREEVGATRSGVALYDLSTYAKFLVQGPGASPACSAGTSDVDVDAGRDRLHRPCQRARRDRDGPDDHAPRRDRVPRPGADAVPAAHDGCCATGCRRARSSPTSRPATRRCTSPGPIA